MSFSGIYLVAFLNPPSVLLQLHGRNAFNLTCPFSLQTKCFICGIGSDYFDTTPHGFETHTLEEHNLANYM